MNRQAIVAVVAFAASALCWSTSTQAYDRWYGGRGVGVGYGVGLGYGLGYGGGVGPYYGYGGYGLGNYGYGSGFGSSVSLEQQAIADTIRAQGEYNKQQSQAMINYEQARSVYLDNQQKWNQVYLERKRISQAQKAQEQQAAMAESARRRVYAAEHPLPPPARLTSSQLDAATGTIHWPTALTSSTFDADRKALEDLFVVRAHTSSTPDLAAQIDASARAFKEKVRTNIREMSSQEYIESQKFLTSMAAEGQYSVN
ncbi:hypothetical protein [Schlesneria paludicola]|uniref:hypothetical protein n=1 Tax=Schlesneria paludicola TaxID=360056 RepID=UPI00029A5AC8|nr:hypothetical protein [Schlesneria paludicola]